MITTMPNHCPACGLPKKKWSGNSGQGIVRGEALYCCDGCAEGYGYICRDRI